MRRGTHARDEVVQRSGAGCVAGVGEEGDKGRAEPREDHTGVVAEAERGGFDIDEDVVFLVLRDTT